MEAGVNGKECREEFKSGAKEKRNARREELSKCCEGKMCVEEEEEREVKGRYAKKTKKKEQEEGRNMKGMEENEIYEKAMEGE